HFSDGFLPASTLRHAIRPIVRRSGARIGSVRGVLWSAFGWLVAFRRLTALAEEVLLHLLNDEVLMLFLPGLEAILVEQHLHVVLPVVPGLFADALIDS